MEGIRLRAQECGYELPGQPEGEGCTMQWLCFTAVPLGLGAPEVANTHTPALAETLVLRRNTCLLWRCALHSFTDLVTEKNIPPMALRAGL